MKTIAIALLLGISVPPSMLRAQPDCSGIYLSAPDFMAGRCSPVYSSRVRSKSSFYELLSNSHFFIIRPGYAWQRIDKQTVFAVKGCDGELVRINEGINYYLINPGERIPLYKAVIYPVSKGSASRVKYGFSRDPASEIKDLTLENLEAVFADNPCFGEAIKSHFYSDSDLYGYNNARKCFELNRVYTECRQLE
jgi:hypothetical protein